MCILLNKKNYKRHQKNLPIRHYIECCTASRTGTEILKCIKKVTGLSPFQELQRYVVPVVASQLLQLMVSLCLPQGRECTSHALHVISSVYIQQTLLSCDADDSFNIDNATVII